MTFSKSIQSLCFSNSNRYIAMGGDDSTAHIVSAQTWEKITDITADSPIYTLSFSMMDERLALGTLDGVLTLLDAQKGFNIVGEMDTNTAPILALDWSSNGKYMALGRNDASVTIHDSQSVFGNFFVPQTELHRGGGAPIHTVAFGNGGKFLAVGGGDWMVAIYSAKAGWALCHEVKMAGWVLSVAWSSDSRFLGIGGTDTSKGGHVVDTRSWDTIDQLSDNKNKFGSGEDVTSLGWSDDGRWFVVAGKGGTAQIVNTKTWEIIKCIGHDQSIKYEADESEAVVSKSLNGHNASLNSRMLEASKSSNGAAPDSATEWSQRSIVHHFSEVCEAFLAPYEFDDPPDLLRLYVPCILMLQVHIQWVGSQGTQTRSKVEQQDEGEPLSSLYKLLTNGIKVMEHILDDEGNIDTWWGDSSKFGLTPKDLRRINAWNESWLKVETEAPIVDVDLIAVADS